MKTNLPRIVLICAAGASITCMGDSGDDRGEGAVEVRVPDDTVTPTVDAGKLPATSEVSASGAFEYHVPIWVPRGRAEMAPSVSLSYSSHGGNGIAGVGWALNAGGSIHRCGKNLSRDEAVDHVEFDNDDNFCLDGEKLVPVARMALPTGMPVPSAPFFGEYRTERESFTRVMAYGSPEPTTWITMRKDGSIAYYGEQSSSRVWGVRHGWYSSDTYAWLLSRVIDRSANAIHYTYYADPLGSATRYLTDITYTHSPYAPYSSAKLRKVEFLYGSRPDPLDRWINGLQLHTALRLSAIRLSAPNPTTVEEVRLYVLAYAESKRTRRSLLTSITECDHDGVCIPPTTFRHHEPPGQQPVTYTRAEYPIEEIKLDTDWWVQLQIFDVDGDGYEDLIHDSYDDWLITGPEYWAVNSNPLLWRGTGDLAAPFPVLPNYLAHLFPNDFLNGNFYARRPNTPTSAAVDRDGDGRAEWLVTTIEDVVDMHQNGTFDSGQHRLRSYEWNQQAEQMESSGTVLDCPMEIGCHYTALDFDGDDLVDIGLLADAGGGAWQRRMHMNQPSAPGTLVDNSSYATSIAADFTGGSGSDLDGNGTGDLMEVNALNTFMTTGLDDGSVYQLGPGSEGLDKGVLADVNGDGLKDLVYPIHIPYWIGDGPQIRINTGNGFADPVTVASIAWPSVDGTPADDVLRDFGFTTYVHDFNGDGRDDLFILCNMLDEDEPVDFRNRGWMYMLRDELRLLLLSDGTNYFLNPLTEPDFLMYHPVARWMGTQLGDLDADGVPEIVSISAGSDFNADYCYPDNLTYRYRCWKGFSIIVGTQPAFPDPFYDRIVQVTDGFGAEEYVDYDHFMPRPNESDPTHTPASLDCEYPDLCPRRGSPLVRLHTRGTRAWDYRYEGARADARGRGGLGFERIEVTEVDPVTGLGVGTSTVTHYDLDRHAAPYGGDVFPFTGAPLARRTVTDVDGVRHEVATNYLREVVWLSNRYYTVETSASESTGVDWVWERNVLVDRVFDAYGNPTQVTRTVSMAGVNGYKDTTYLVYENRPTDWLIGMPIRVQTESKAPSGLTGRRLVTHAYDAKGLLAKTTIEPGPPVDKDTWLHTTLMRNVAGLVTKVTRLDGYGQSRADGIFYDTAGVYVSSTQNALLHTTEYGYHPGIDRLAVTLDPNGNQTTFTYDGLGRPTGFQEPDGAAATIAYGKILGGPMWMKRNFSSGFSEEEQFDQYGRSVQRWWIGFDGQTVDSATLYDSRGRVERATLPRAVGDSIINLVDYEWDNLDRPRSVTYPDASVEQWHYPAFGVVESVDKEGRVQRITASIDGLPVLIERQNGFEHLATELEYGPFGLPSAVRGPDASLPAITMKYDRLGRRTEVNDPNAGVIQSAYNAFGELRSETPANGFVRKFTFDALGRPIKRTTEDGSATFVWDIGPDAIGRLTHATSPDGVVIENEYDSLSRPAVTRYSQGTEVHEIERSYDLVGRLDVLYYPETPDHQQFRIRHGYGQDGTLAYIQDEHANRRLYEVLGRAADSQLTAERKGDVIDVVRDYDQASRELTALRAEPAGGGAPLIALAYTRFADGRLQSRTDAVNDILDEAAYDRLGRMNWWRTTRGGDIRTQTYEWDLAGRLRWVRDYAGFGNPAGTLEYSYPAAGSPRPHAALQVGTDAFTYDAMGREIERRNGGAIDRWIDYNSYSLPKKGAEDGAAFTVEYDAFGQRFRKVSSHDTIYVGGLYEKRVRGTDMVHTYVVHGPSGPVARLDYTLANPGKFIPTYLFQDELGSTVLTTKETGQVSGRFFYDPWGRRVEPDGTPVPEPSTSSTLPGFTGHEHDDELGLVNMRGRLFDPVARKFLTPDPLLSGATEGRGLDRYGYVGFDPFNKIDPTGFQEEDEGSVAPGIIDVYVFGSKEAEEKFWAEENLWREYERPQATDQAASGGYDSPVGWSGSGNNPVDDCVGHICAPWADQSYGDPFRPRPDLSTSNLELLILGYGDQIAAGVALISVAPLAIYGAFLYGAGALPAASYALGNGLGAVSLYGGGKAVINGVMAGDPMAVAQGLHLGGSGLGALAGGGLGLGSGFRIPGARPQVVFDFHKAPNLVRNMADAQAAGYPRVLTYAGAGFGGSNRSVALGAVKCQKFPGMSWDEYPFASSTQGGGSTFLRPIPVSEQNYQGGVLGSFYRNHGLRPGDKFEVILKNLPPSP